MDEELLNKIFCAALNLFFVKEKSGLEINVAERSLANRLAAYLEAEAARVGLKGYFVDTEYNRKQNGEIKTIIDGDSLVIKVNPDVIFHSRGNSVENDNLIAIEMKKSDRPRKEKASDRKRLEIMTKPSYDDVWSADGDTHPEYVCGYKLGYYLELDIASQTALLETYKLGQLIKAVTINL